MATTANKLKDKQVKNAQNKSGKVEYLNDGDDFI